MNYFNLYRDIWSWHKKFSKIENSDTYWQRVLAESEEIRKKYNCQFATDLVLTVIAELERESKQLNKKECEVIKT